uniref:hypothetical protein n=1 Tax=Trebonia sp. TaxID=2767075 RepID=UPI00260D990F
PAGPWDTPARRPGGARRSARRAGSRGARGNRRPLAVIGVIVVVAIVIGVVVLVRRNPGSVPQAGAPSPTPSAQAPKSAPTARPSAAVVGYTLTTPAVAGGYPKLTPVPADVQSAAATLSQDVRGPALSGGGKITGQFSAAYQLDDGQVLAFTGFEGTFTPAKVLAGLASLVTDQSTEPAGSHGGMLACATAAGSTPGTVCVWVTTTTIGVTEFFSPDGPEVVTVQSKAASDTLNVRDSVEVAKSRS